MLDQEKLADLSEHFPTITESVSKNDVQAALKVVGIDIPGYQVSLGVSDVQ